MPNTLPGTYSNPVFAYRRSADQDAARPVRHPVVVVGAGPTGLVAALDLAAQGIPCVVLTKGNTVSTGSRAICFSKRTLEIIHRISPETAGRMLQKGVVWDTGKVFYRDSLVYHFHLLPEEGHKIPAFINLQQYYFEEYLIEAILAHPLIDLRWEHEVTGVVPGKAWVGLTVQTPDGPYALEAAYLLACDGVHSRVREVLDIPFEGEHFDENFLIADIRMGEAFPAERWFWFDPPFNPGFSALLHKQPDGVWRIDLQLGRDVDRERELDPERIRARLRKMLGPEVAFELEWTSLYRFRCMRIPRFDYGRVFFAGDSAHLVSPYGARGANGGIQDVDNLVWKLALVLKGSAPASLLDTYNEERSPAADENIRHSTRATDFITPKTAVSRAFRDAALALAGEHNGMKKMVNSGRLSNAFKYLNSPLTTPDAEAWSGALQPGYPAKDAPLIRNGRPCWLIDLLGNRFVLLGITTPDQAASMERALVDKTGLPLSVLAVAAPGNASGDALADQAGLFSARYDAAPGSWFLFRPDACLAARGRSLSVEGVAAALEQAAGRRAAAATGAEVTDKHPDYPDDERYHQFLTAFEHLAPEEAERLGRRLLLLLLEHPDAEVSFPDLLKEAGGEPT